jgi:uncharacterized protein
LPDEAEAPSAEEDEPTGPFRRCLATGVVRPKDELLRFVVAPDGTVVPDLAGRLPGRGLWLTARRDIVSLAVAKRLFARAARAPVSVPSDLADRIDLLLRQRCRDLIGMARRSGQAVAGYEKVRAALDEGKARVLLAAADGGEVGREKVRAAAPGLPVVDVLDSHELGAAFGREHVVHAVIGGGRIARALLVDAARLSDYRKPMTDEAMQGVPGRASRRKD